MRAFVRIIEEETRGPEDLTRGGSEPRKGLRVALLGFCLVSAREWRAENRSGIRLWSRIAASWMPPPCLGRVRHPRLGQRATRGKQGEEVRSYWAAGRGEGLGLSKALGIALRIPASC